VATLLRKYFLLSPVLSLKEINNRNHSLYTRNHSRHCDPKRRIVYILSNDSIRWIWKASLTYFSISFVVSQKISDQMW